MTRVHLSILILAFVCLSGSCALAAERVSLKLGQKVSTGMRRDPPTFVSLNPPRLLDRGQLLQVGKGMWAEQHKFYFRQVQDYAEVVIEAPLADFLAAHPELFPGAEGSGFSRYMVEELLFLDRQDGLAAIYLYDKSKGAKKHYLLWWDLTEKKISRAVLLQAEEDNTYLVTVVPVLYEPRSKEFFCRIDHARGSREEKTWSVTLQAMQPVGERTVISFAPARYLSKKVFADQGSSRVLFVEYAELAQPDPPPQGHLVSLADGQRREIPIPMTTYGAAFGPRGEKLYLYSNQLRTMQVMDLKTGVTIKQAKVGGGGHDLGWPLPGKLMLLRHAGMIAFDPTTLKQVQFLPLKPFIEGHIWIPGSFFAAGRAFIRNGEEVLMMELGSETVPARKVQPRKKTGKKSGK